MIHNLVKCPHDLINMSLCLLSSIIPHHWNRIDDILPSSLHNIIVDQPSYGFVERHTYMTFSEIIFFLYFFKLLLIQVNYDDSTATNRCTNRCTSHKLVVTRSFNHPPRLSLESLNHTFPVPILYNFLRHSIKLWSLGLDNKMLGFLKFLPLH